MIYRKNEYGYIYRFVYTVEQLNMYMECKLMYLQSVRNVCIGIEEVQ